MTSASLRRWVPTLSPSCSRTTVAIEISYSLTVAGAVPDYSPDSHFTHKRETVTRIRLFGLARPTRIACLVYSRLHRIARAFLCHRLIPAQKSVNLARLAWGHGFILQRPLRQAQIEAGYMIFLSPTVHSGQLSQTQSSQNWKLHYRTQNLLSQ